MSIEEIRELCLSLPETEEGLPFGEETLVFKVKGKIFLLMSLDAEEVQFNVKCEPQLAIEYRERYPEVQPGYHMNKTHWNTVLVSENLGKSLITKMIKHSYDLVLVKNKRKTGSHPVKKGGGKAKKQ